MALSVVAVLLVLSYAGNNMAAFMVHVDAARDCKRDEDCPGNLFCNPDDKQCTDDPNLNSHHCSDDVNNKDSHGKDAHDDNGIKGDGKGKGNNHDRNKDDDKGKECKPVSFLRGTGHKCNRELNAECCKEGQKYPRFKCSPVVTERTKATLTVNDFRQGGDGGGASECHGVFQKGMTKVVALSTGWYDKGRKCGKKVKITLGGKTVEATVVDECDSFNGCDEEHSFQPPCDNNIVDASAAVWEALGVSQDDDRFGFTDITWTDA